MWDPRRVKLEAGGMLPVEVYDQLYDVGFQAGGGLLLEIGTAHGAATVALASGAMERGLPFRVVTVDPFGGPLSSRTRFGSPEDNMAIVAGHLRRFGVQEHVEVLRGTVAELLRPDLTDARVLLIDADGRIDRDLDALHDRLAPGCRVVLDDIDDHVHLTRVQGRRLVDQKHRIAAALVERYLASDVLRAERRIGDTGFFRLGEADRAAVLDAALDAYRELVFAELPDVPWRQRTADRMPEAYEAWTTVRTWPERRRLQLR